ncbi:VOC family protein [Dactylosporangium sp. CS-047395]|uniref:VOC family protein n=1 Tax=Dactylosporangium sp. CS-047395 TaxID=3239936 RepID=UPI003D946E69
MPSSNRAPSNDSRTLLILGLLAIGGFLAFCGVGAANPLVVALGVLLAAVGPVMIMVANNRNKIRLYVHGTALVEEITARPTAEGRTARGRLKLTITATGIHGVSVTGTDPAIPVDKWPERGATLPVQVLKGNPRKFTVQWDRVDTHQQVVLAGQRRGEPDDDFSDLNAAMNADGAYDPDDDYRRPAPFATVPPDNTPTLTDLPPVQAEIDEPVGARVATVAPPAEQIPDAARRPGGLRGFMGFPPRQAAKPRHAAAPNGPTHRPTEPLGAAATATAFTETAAQPAPPPATSEMAPEIAEEPPAATEIAEEPDAIEVEEAVEEAGAEPPTASRPTVIGEEDEPIIMRLRSTPRQHRRPSPHPRTAARTRPNRTRPTPPEPPALPSTEAAAATQPPAPIEPTTAQLAETETETAAETAAEPIAVVEETTKDQHALVRPESFSPDDAEATDEPIVTSRAEVLANMEAPETYTIPEAGSRTPALALDPEAGGEIEWWEGADEPRPPAAYYPDRESETPPTRGIYVPAPVIDGELAPVDDDATIEGELAEDTAGTTAEETAAEAPAAEDTEAGDTEAESGPANGNGATATVDEAHPSENGRTPFGRSAWSANGRGPVPVGAGLYSAPPVFRPPAETESDGVDEDEEPVAPDPYATEHYLPPDEDDDGEDADALEEQPLSEGAVAEFLAAGPRRQPTTPLDGVHGVSITLIVSDLQRSRRFYRETLGLTELDSGETSAVLETGTARVVLRQVADMPPVDRRVVHLNLDVPDVYEAYERLREQGVDFVHRPRVVPQGEQLELCSATFRDPDGHAIALTRWELRR